MKIKIRKVILCDVKALLPLISQLGYPITEEQLIARLALYQGYNDAAWVALVDEKPIGVIAVHIYDLFHCTERYSRIVTIVVDAPYRRLGVGKQLLAYAERHAKEKGCTALELTSSLKRLKFGAYDFYGSYGYNNNGEFESRYFRKFLKQKEGPVI
ncbi:MAG TPA: GNAT family N-acetyltransferase [Candidatus Berkiella sp.]|nr:GNAT family N-acetyltransferase [Candidatus Berkiella sp.]